MLIWILATRLRGQVTLPLIVGLPCQEQSIHGQSWGGVSALTPYYKEAWGISRHDPNPQPACRDQKMHPLGRG